MPGSCEQQPPVALSRIHAELHFSEPVAPGRYWPELIRGVFLSAVRDEHCLWDQQRDCRECEHRTLCLYPRFWDPSSAPLVANPRSGYRLVAPWHQRPCTHVPARLEVFHRDDIDAAMIDGIVARSLQVAARRGIGRERVPARIELHREQSRLEMAHSPSVTPGKAVEIRVLACSPVVLRHRKRPVDRIDALTLTIAALRRLRQFGWRWPELIWKRLHRVAEAVSPVEEHVARCSWSRYSARTGQTRPVTGLTGWWRFRVPAQAVELIPIWRCAARLGIGRHTTAGCGNVKITTDDQLPDHWRQAAHQAGPACLWEASQ